MFSIFNTLIKMAAYYNSFVFFLYGLTTYVRIRSLFQYLKHKLAPFFRTWVVARLIPHSTVYMSCNGLALNCIVVISIDNNNNNNRGTPLAYHISDWITLCLDRESCSECFLIMCHSGIRLLAPEVISEGLSLFILTYSDTDPPAARRRVILFSY